MIIGPQNPDRQEVSIRD